MAVRRRSGRESRRLTLAHEVHWTRPMKSFFGVVVGVAAATGLTGCEGGVEPRPEPPLAVSASVASSVVPAPPSPSVAVADDDDASERPAIPVVSITAMAPPGARSLPISVEAGDHLASGLPDPSNLVPTSCILKDGKVTATGGYRGDHIPESYLRVGGVVNLYVYGGPRGGMEIGNQLAGSHGQHPMTDTKPWSITVGINSPSPEERPESCQVAVQPMHRSFPPVTATAPAPSAGHKAQPLALTRDSSDVMVRTTSCSLKDGVVTATVEIDHDVPQVFFRLGENPVLYVFASPTPPEVVGPQIADLRQERPAQLHRGDPWGAWALTVPVSTAWGAPVLCQVELQPTQNLQGAPH